MDETQFIAFCAVLVASFAWIQWTRTSGRFTRALGVIAFIGAWLVFRLVQRA